MHVCACVCACCNEKFYTKSHKSFDFHLTKQMGDNVSHEHSAHAPFTL